LRPPLRGNISLECLDKRHKTQDIRQKMNQISRNSNKRLSITIDH
jgi:hypothetical protein